MEENGAGCVQLKAARGEMDGMGEMEKDEVEGGRKGWEGIWIYGWIGEMG